VITLEDAKLIVSSMPVDEVSLDHDLLAMYRNPHAISRVLELLYEPFQQDGLTAIVGTESRGFLLGGMASVRYNLGFAAVRKQGRYLPGKKFDTLSEPDWEGKQTSFEIQSSALTAADRVLVVDDWYTTGSQARATMSLIRETGATAVGAAVVVEEGTDAENARLGKFHALLNWSEKAHEFVISRYNLATISRCCASRSFQTEP
jgi:adenine phosphoribosyltransferase